MNSATLVDYAKSLDCIHCGLCLRTCPTYQLTGAESSSPRGRVHLMRSVAEGELEADAGFAEEMDFCLLCRNCESVCPSGVQFGQMMEHTRGALGRSGARPWWARLARAIGFRGVLPHRVALALCATALRLGQRSGLLRLVAPLFGARGRAAARLPDVPPRGERRRLPERTPARGARVGAVSVLEGCVMPELFGRVNRATVEVLAAVGLDVHAPRGATCCGSLHAHNGDLEGARALARRTIRAFERARDDEGRMLAVVVNSAGCTAHMKEYGALLRDDPAWRERAEAFSARVRDFSEHLAREHTEVLCERLGERLGSPSGVPQPVTYDDPCHLCHGQQIRDEPRALLALVPGLERVELDESESCCGSAGIYSLLRPADSLAILGPRLDTLERSGARTLVTQNPGCQLQWSSGVQERRLDVRVVHLAEVLAEALAQTPGRQST